MLKVPANATSSTQGSFNQYNVTQVAQQQSLYTQGKSPISTHVAGTTNWHSQNLIEKLLELGIHKQELATRIEVSVRTLNNVINGRVAKLKPPAFKRLLGLYCKSFIN